jgi:hypothetical protein
MAEGQSSSSEDQVEGSPMTSLVPVASSASPMPAAAPAAAAAGTAPPRGELTSPPLLANPKMRLDTSLNIVVLEFHDSTGELRTKIPSERQLRAYQQGQDPAMPGAPQVVETAA